MKYLIYPGTSIQQMYAGIIIKTRLIIYKENYNE